jgi:hypothetical protein
LSARIAGTDEYRHGNEGVDPAPCGIAPAVCDLARPRIGLGGVDGDNGRGGFCCVNTISDAGAAETMSEKGRYGDDYCARPPAIDR